MFKSHLTSVLSALFLSTNFAPAFADDSGCGHAPPALSPIAESSETVKGQLQGQADLLSKLVGKAELGGVIETARKNIYHLLA
jgi:hypothetical protein